MIDCTQHRCTKFPFIAHFSLNSRFLLLLKCLIFDLHLNLKYFQLPLFHIFFSYFSNQNLSYKECVYLFFSKILCFFVVYLVSLISKFLSLLPPLEILRKNPAKLKEIDLIKYSFLQRTIQPDKPFQYIMRFDPMQPKQSSILKNSNSLIALY